MSDEMAFAKYLKECAQKTGKSNIDITTEIGTDVSKYFSGDTLPDRKRLGKIARSCGADPDRLERAFVESKSDKAQFKSARRNPARRRVDDEGHFVPGSGPTIGRKAYHWRA